jgi:hypothetical protein
MRPEDMADSNVRVEEQRFAGLHEMPAKNVILRGPEIFWKKAMTFEDMSLKGDITGGQNIYKPPREGGKPFAKLQEIPTPGDRVEGKSVEHGPTHRGALTCGLLMEHLL